MEKEWQKPPACSTARRARLAWVAGLALACVPGIAGRALAADECASRPVEVADIEDDAAIRLRDGTVVQMSGIEPPGSPAALQALRDAMAGPLGEEGVSLRGESPPDRYNRIHAMVMLADGLSLQWNLVADGVARVRLLPGEHLCGEKLLIAEDAARIGHFGLWAGHEYAIWRADDPSLLEQIGLYALVEGRVVSVGAGSRIVFLDFGHNWRRDFTVMVAASEADRFAAAGKKLESLANHTVRVRGVVEENNGPAIRVDNPEAIEVLDGDVQ
jgi:endonuclease YncB( thermonuclease family)